MIRITTVPMALAFPLRGQPAFMQANGFDVLMVSSDGDELPALLDREKVRHVIVPMTRKITPFRDVASLCKLWRLFKKEKPDIVHAETPKAGLLAMVAGAFAGVPVRIYTQAGIVFVNEKGLRLMLMKTVERITYAFATNVWPNSPSTKKFILDCGLAKAEKLSVIGGGSSNGVDTTRFNKENLDPAQLAEIQSLVRQGPDQKIFLYIGRLVKDKGIPELVEVFGKMSAADSQLRLLLTGMYENELDPLSVEIKSRIENDPAIIHVAWTDKPEYFMAAADYFIFPSHREGFPNVLLEAGSMGLPVICSRILGNIDIVRDGKTGLIFTCKNRTELESAIRDALADPTRMKAMAQTLKEEVRTQFDRNKFWNAQLAAYNQLANVKS